MTDPDAFHMLLRRFMTKKDRFPAALSKLSGVSQRTIENWAASKSKPSRRGGLINLLKVAAAFPLSEREADQLLVVVPHPRIAALRNTARASDDQEQLDILAPWDAGGRAAPPDVLHQLRAPTTDFVARVHETEQLVSSLDQVAAAGVVASISGVRGMGGIGKTELAYVVGQRLGYVFPDAQLVLDLQGSRATALTPERVLQTVISAFFPEEQLPDDLSSLTARYRTVLAGKRVFILADDARDADQVLPLRPPAGSALLVTSRFRFEIPGMTTLDLDELPEADAIQLLQKINPVIPDATAAEIARLCGYLPIALRVVAGITKKTSRELSEYVALLRDERARLSRMVDERANLDVEASLSLSYKLLTPEEQRVLAQIGVFATDFDRRAAEMVVTLVEGADLVDELDALLEANLLEHDSAQQRYSLHELVRIFALARLAEAGGERAARLRHARHYIEVIADAERQFRSGGDSIALGIARFDRERAQIDMARAWLQQHAGDWEIDELLVADADATAYIGDLRYSKRDGRIPQLTLAVAAATRRGHRAAQSRFLGNLGAAYVALGDIRTAMEYLQQTRAVVIEIGDRQGEGNVLANLGSASMTFGDTRSAIKYYQRALTLYRKIGDRQGEGNVLANLGSASMTFGDTRSAIACYQEALTLFHELGNRQGEGKVLANLGDIANALDDTRKAIEYYQQARTIWHAIGDHQLEGIVLGHLGKAYTTLDDTRKAIEYYQQARTIWHAIGDHQAEGRVLGHLGAIYAARGDSHQAIQFHQQHLAVARRIHDLQGEGIALGNLGVVYAALGDNHRAIEFYQKTLAIMRELADPHREAKTLSNLANSYIRLGDTHQAIEFYQLQLALVRKLGDRQSEEEVLTKLAKAYTDLGDTSKAGNLYMKMFDMLLHDVARVAIGDEEGRKWVEATLAQLDSIGLCLTSLVQRIWAGERDTDFLVLGLDELHTALIKKVLELVGVYEGHKHRTPTQAHLGLPEALRHALEQRDEAAFSAALGAVSRDDYEHVLQSLASHIDDSEAIRAALPPSVRGALFSGPTVLQASIDALLDKTERQTAISLIKLLQWQTLARVPDAVREALDQRRGDILQSTLAALPPDESAVIFHQLQRSGLIGIVYEPDIVRMARVEQQFLALLGDIALATHGNAVARVLAEAALPLLEADGWQFGDAARRIWAGQRDEAALTAGLDEQDKALVRRVLSLIADGPEMIFVAGSIQIADLYRKAASATVQALTSGDATQRGDLVKQFENLAAQIEQQPAEPWRELASHLRALATQLSDAG